MAIKNGISTPCVDQCKLDKTTGFCVGCRRSKAEIVAWRQFSEAERLAVMAELADRPAASVEAVGDRDEFGIDV